MALGAEKRGWLGSPSCRSRFDFASEAGRHRTTRSHLVADVGNLFYLWMRAQIRRTRVTSPTLGGRARGSQTHGPATGAPELTLTYG